MTPKGHFLKQELELNQTCHLLMTLGYEPSKFDLYFTLHILAETLLLFYETLVCLSTTQCGAILTCSECWICTSDLRVMSPTRYYFSNSQCSASYRFDTVSRPRLGPVLTYTKNACLNKYMQIYESFLNKQVFCYLIFFRLNIIINNKENSVLFVQIMNNLYYNEILSEFL